MKTFIAIIGSVILAAGAAFADDTKYEKTFSELDTNQDGVLTQSEAAADQELVAVFVQVDANQDGMLSNDEFNSIDDEVEEGE